MKVKSCLYVRAISVLLVLTFITGQGLAGQGSSYCSKDTLAASLVSDSKINPDRSNPLRNDIAGKAEPGAIGNGAPLMELANGNLPPRVTLQGQELVTTVLKLRGSISMAMELSIANQEKVPAQHKARFQKALENLVDFSNRVEKIVYLYNADIRTPEDYLLGFNFRENIGLSLELIERLYSISSTRLAQYIFHECVPEKGIITERDDHRAVYTEIQSAIFGTDEVRALKQNLRDFIGEKVVASVQRETASSYLKLLEYVESQVDIDEPWSAFISRVRDNFDIDNLILRQSDSVQTLRTLAKAKTPEVIDQINRPDFSGVLIDSDGDVWLVTEIRKAGKWKGKRFYIIATIRKYERVVDGEGYPLTGAVIGGLLTGGIGGAVLGGLIGDEITDEEVIVIERKEYDGRWIEPHDFVSLLRGSHIVSYFSKEDLIGMLREKPTLASGTESKLASLPTTKIDSQTLISEDLPIRAKVFTANLTRILAEHPDQLFFMGIETDIGESQKAQMMPIYKAIDQIENLTDSNGKRLFPNLMVKRAKAEELVTMAGNLSKEGKLNLNNAFIGARKSSVDRKLYDSINGDGRAWISAIDDANAGSYIPVFEAITLNMMAYLNADITAIKNFYDAISDKPIDPAKLQDMIRNRIIYILPKITAFDTKQLRELYELAHQVYIAA